ncbi:methyltransferase domain-containing protein [Streptomyces sp. SID3343]|nr:methyltransferase domain-containing protein [Streptomyces sp. SID3343]
MTPDHLMRLGLGFTAAKVLLGAVEVGVFTELSARGPLDAGALGSALGLHARSARDFFDTLVALDLLDRADGRYVNTPTTEYFLDRDKPTYIGDALTMLDARLYGFWANLTEALRTGSPQNEAAAGGDPYAGIYADPARRALFQRAMGQLSRPSIEALADRFGWEGYGSVADIGAGDGALVCHLAKRHPHLTGAAFDLPEAAAAVDAYVRAAGLRDRIRFWPGDFHDPAQALPSADVLVLGHVLHDWDLAAKRALLAKAWAALPVGGALVAFEAFPDDERRANPIALLLGLNVLIETPAGAACTIAQCRELVAEAGFRHIRAEPLAGPESMVIGVK